ncbi:uncharacterized protein VICG_01999 [Vittaforma corneae ATCC 50505]|uniref:Uncharacterized protein n=1 Tax=Vittaforma corneae (strain ATCC 50505) TaxID=993615 RepID=L2GK06_VITCO|nr:uncharacterized protein VICG_01999 [Vittaforma corneae ATCC 50505]ELA40969.1 hypothetical protein VICG_01999 [Vittaforma corneae ATCC 50505]
MEIEYVYRTKMCSSVASFLILLLDIVLSLDANEVARNFQSNNRNVLQRLVLEIRNEETVANRALAQTTNQLNLSRQANGNFKQAADPLRDNVIALEKDVREFNDNNVDASIPVLQQQKRDLQSTQTVLRTQINVLPNTDLQAVTDEKDGYLKKEKELDEELKKQQEISKAITMFSETDEEFLTILKMEPFSAYAKYTNEYDKNSIRIQSELEKLIKSLDDLKKDYEKKASKKDHLVKEKECMKEKITNYDVFLKGLQDLGDGFLENLKERLDKIKEELKALGANMEGLSPLEHPRLALLELQSRIEKKNEEKNIMQSNLLEIEKKMEEYAEQVPDKSIELTSTDSNKLEEAMFLEEQMLALNRVNKEFLSDLLEHSRLNKIIEDLTSNMTKKEVAYLSIFSLGTFAYIIYNIVLIFI